MDKKCPPIPAAVFAAIYTGDIKQLESLYKPGVDLERIARHSAKAKRPEVLKWCYSQGWTHPSKDSLNDRFYLAAICNGTPEFFQVLLNHGFDLNSHYTEHLGDALACAVIFGHHDFAKWLLDHGHRVNPHEPIYGDSSITSTISGDVASIDMLKALLDHGFELKEYGTAIAAADEGNLEALKMLLAHGGFNIDEVVMWWYPFDEDRDEPEESEGTALYRACRQGHLECAALLLEHWADPKAKDLGGISCLQVTREREHEDVVELLLIKGVTE